MGDDHPDLDPSRAAIGERALVATAATYLTQDVASKLPFDSLASFKGLLKRFFSTDSWSLEDRRALSELVTPVIAEGWWEHELGEGLTLSHGIRAGQYVISASGAIGTVRSIFGRAFTGPVIPEPTPHPRKVKFSFSGEPAPGVWVRRGDAERPVDSRLDTLFSEPDITDVMVAGDFVTIGLVGTASWENRLEPLLDIVTNLFGVDQPVADPAGRTREELLQEAGRVGLREAEVELHLLDPTDAVQRQRLLQALDSSDARHRRIAVALLAEADDGTVRADAIRRGFADSSRLVRRTAIDVAGDAGDDRLRPFLEEAAADADPWIRWRAARALGVIGLDESRALLQSLTSDPDFNVRFEAESILQREAH